MEHDLGVEEAVDAEAFGLGVDPEVSGEDQVGLAGLDADADRGAAAVEVPVVGENDANRALMGANMQRQAVPLVLTDPPLIATGMEKTVAENSGMLITGSTTPRHPPAAAAKCRCSPDASGSPARTRRSPAP